ncbi:MAG: hypothetical protein ABW033_03115 [Acidimicrobiia bacterium]
MVLAAQSINWIWRLVGRAIFLVAAIGVFMVLARRRDMGRLGMTAIAVALILLLVTLAILTTT